MGWAPRVLPLKQDLIAAARPSLLIVMAAVLLVLVIGCANIANLQLARAAAREREVAVRRALGASLARMVREQVTETLVVSLAGGALGLVLTIWALDALMQLAPAALPRRAEVELGWRVVAFSLDGGHGDRTGLRPVSCVSCRTRVSASGVEGGGAHDVGRRTRARAASADRG